MTIKTKVFDAFFELSRHSLKKNQKSIGYRKTSKGVKPFIRDAKNGLLSNELSVNLKAALRKYENFKPIDTSIIAEFTFYFPNEKFFTKKKTQSLTIGDLSNLYQGVEDCLQKCQVIKNDALICGHDGSRRVPWDKPTYGLKIVLYSFQDIEINYSNSMKGLIYEPSGW